MAEHLFGRTLVRVQCSDEDDRESLPARQAWSGASRHVRDMADRFFPWLVVVTRLEAAGKLTREEAAEARADLWRPFVVWTNPPAAEVGSEGSQFAPGEDGLPKDMAATAWRA